MSVWAVGGAHTPLRTAASASRFRVRGRRISFPSRQRWAAPTPLSELLLPRLASAFVADAYLFLHGRGGRCPLPSPNCCFRVSLSRSWPTHIFSFTAEAGGAHSPLRTAASASQFRACNSRKTKRTSPRSGRSGKIPIGRPWAKSLAFAVTSLKATAWRPRPTRAALRACNPGTRGAPFRRPCGCTPRTAWRAGRCCPAGPFP